MHKSILSLRRIRAAILSLLLIAPAIAAMATGRSPATTKPTVARRRAVSSVGMTVANLDRSIDFFRSVLSFEMMGEIERIERHPNDAHEIARRARLKLGDEVIELTEFKTAGRPFPADTRANDHWFQHIAIIVSDMNAAYAKLKKHGVREASRDGPQRLPDWNNNAAGIRAFYFRDPDGHYLEILQFPPDKGDPKWHRADDRLFLGIDHTAIVVANTESSLRFYRDRLGFCLVGGSENYGPEQEKLNNVLGAHLRITTLRGTSGPAIEFLEYLNPRDGRDIRSDQQCNDIAYWKTTIEVDNPVAIEGTDSIRFPAQRNSMPNGNWNTDDLSRPIDLSDPTGHAIRLQKAHAQGAPG